MNNPSPLVPQGSMMEQKNKTRNRVRLAVFFVLSIHVIALMALLMQGCRKPNDESAMPADATPAPSPMGATNVPPVDTNLPTAAMTPAPMESVPAPAPPTLQDYVVLKGDTLSSIAHKFGVTIKAIEEANPGVQPTKLQIGQKLMIPPAAPNSLAAPANAGPGASVSSSGEEFYTVKSGDTLTRIAKQFGTTVSAIRDENSLTTDRIKVGQKLKIPAKIATPPAAPSAPALVPPAGNPGM